MTVVPFVPDAPPGAVLAPQPSADSTSSFARALDDIGATFDRANRAEDAFAAHRGDLTASVYARATADVTLAVAAAAAQRAAQAMQTVLSMQV